MRKVIRPLTLDEAKEFVKGDTFTAILSFKLQAILTCYGVDDFYVVCNERLFVNAFLQNQQSKIVGHRPSNSDDDQGEILIEISGELHVLE